MGEDAVNDDSVDLGIARREPDPSGEAAILLVESLIHGLIAKTVLSVTEAVEIVDVAVEVRSETETEVGQSRALHRKSVALLTSIGDSLRRDAPRND